MENNNVNDIAKLAAAGLQIKEVGEVPVAFVPLDYRVENLEPMLFQPTRKRGSVTLQDPVSFIDYINLHKKADTHLYATVEPAKFLAVLNDHGATEEDAHWRDHRASYACPHAKEWMVWTASSGKPMNQVMFAEFIENNLVDIVVPPDEPKAPAGTDMLAVATTFRAQKKVAFQSGQLLSNGQVQFQYVENIEGNAGPKGQINVPERFFIGIPVFEGGDPYKIEAKLRWRLQDGGGLAMWYELVRAHKVQEAAFMDVWRMIEAHTGIKLWRGMPDATK